MKKTRKKISSNKIFVNNLIIGAGPAGLQLGYYFKKANRDYRILEKTNRVGIFFEKYPIHRTLISLNKKYNFWTEDEFNLRHDWNSLLSDDKSLRFPKYSDELYPDAEVMIRYLRDFQKKNKLKIKFKCVVIKIKKIKHKDYQFKIITNQDIYYCKRLFMATGNFSYTPKIKGIEHTTAYEDLTLDLAPYRNKRVAIIGGGNSAFEVANYLAGTAGYVFLIKKTPIRLAWETHFAGDLRSINNTILDMFQFKALHIIQLGAPLSIKKNRRGIEITTEVYAPQWVHPNTTILKNVFDHVIRCTGWKAINEKLFSKECLPKIKEGRLPVLSPMWESSVKNLFFIGTSMRSRDRKTASSFINGFRYNIRTLFNLLEEKDFGIPYPSKTFSYNNDIDLSTLSHFILKRFSTTSSLYPLFGFMGDLVILKPGFAEMIFELPVDYIKQNKKLFLNQENAFILTLEFAFERFPNRTSSLDFIAAADIEHFDCSPFIHPVIRRYKKGKLVEEQNMYEEVPVRFLHYFGEEIFHVNTIKNLLNRTIRVTEEIFSEQTQKRKRRYWTKAETLAWFAKYRNSPTPCINYKQEFNKNLIKPKKK